MRRLWDAREALLGRLESLPQALWHGDVERRNAFLCRRPDGEPRTALIDWAFVGTTAIGEEMGHTAGVRAAYDDAPQAVERAAFGGYLTGLRQAGWDGDERAVRFAAATHTALRWAYRWTANAVVVAHDPTLAAQGWDAAEMAGWAARMAYYALDRADEALDLLAVL
jgi:hypothetical protein